MPTARDPLAAYIIAENIRQCVEDRLVETWAMYPELVPQINGESAAIPPRSCTIAGGYAWDDCECGQLIVAIESSHLSAQFPIPSSEGASITVPRCGAPIRVFNMLVSMLRCAPGMDDDGNPPLCEELDAAAQFTVIDADAVLKGVQCCLADMFTTRDEKGSKVIADFTIGTQTFTGPDGRCQGSELPVQVGVMNSCPCPPRS